MHAAARSPAAPARDRRRAARRPSGILARDSNREDRAAEGHRGGLPAPSLTRAREPGQRRCAPPLHLKVGPLALDPASHLADIGRSLILRSRAEAGIEDLDALEVMARALLDTGEVSRLDIEAQLAKVGRNGPDAFLKWGMALADRLSDERLRRCGLPECAEYPTDVGLIDGTHLAISVACGCNVVQCSSLRRCSEALRKEVFQALRFFDPGFMWASEAYSIGYYFSEAVPRAYPDSRDLSETFLRKAWDRALESGEAETYEHEGEEITQLFGLGTYEQFCETVRLAHRAYREQHAKRPVSRRAEREWRARLAALKKLRRALGRQHYWSALNMDDHRAMCEGFCLSMGPAGERLLESYFQDTDSQNGEVPGGTLDLRQVGGLINGLTWVKSLRAFVHLLSDA